MWTVSEWRCCWWVLGVLLQGLGALIVRVDAADILHKLFWGGGAVSLATSSADFHVLKCRPADKLEDGTVNFLDIISLKVCACVCHSWHLVLACRSVLPAQAWQDRAVGLSSACVVCPSPVWHLLVTRLPGQGKPSS